MGHRGWCINALPDYSERLQLDTILISIDYRDPAWIAIAFIFGLLFKQIKLPPMVGFLVAGFVLNFFGAESDQFLLAVANLGVTLLLFTIGLKLRVNTLIRPEIWATAGLHMVVFIAIAASFLFVLGAIGIALFDELDLTTTLIVAFALSFSSTVFAVKTLEDRGALISRYGQVAIGVLIIQDIAAVVFLAVSSGKLPTVWALGLFLLIPGRYLLGFVLARSGHKELLAIFGFVVALGSSAIFELVGMKGDLGALIVGVLLAQFAKADELAKTLLGFKDVFLICFFLTIGLTGLPTWETVAVATILLLLIPIKTAMFLFLLSKFHLRARAATLGALILGNYSEFGLIVGAIAISAGWLQQEWLTVIALVLSASFILASPLNVSADIIYVRFRKWLEILESDERLSGDDDIRLGGHRVLVFGMGRVGRAAYDEMREHFGYDILGIDLDEAQVELNRLAGRSVVLGDATNPEFWSRLGSGSLDLDLILMAMPHHTANIEAANWVRDHGYTGPIVSTALYPDQEKDLKENGIDEVYNIYANAGAGAASHMRKVIEDRKSAAEKINR